jgi:beta-lactamase regulating signal transducer with metallopeptidase domain
VDALLYIGLWNAAVATVLAIVAGTVTRFCRRPAVAHALWLLVLVKLVTPPLVPVRYAWPESDRELREAEESKPLFDGRNSDDDVPPTSFASPQHVVWVEISRPTGFMSPQREQGDDAVGLGDSTHPTASPPRQQGIEASGWPGLESAEAPDYSKPGLPQTPAPATHQETPGPATQQEELIHWQQFPAAVWLTGSLIWWSIAGVRIARFRRLLRHAQPATTALQDRARILAKQLGLQTCPEISLVSAPISPLLWSLAAAPTLLLPAALWERLSEAQCDTLLAHELAHLRRRDHWVRRLEFAVLGLYWWLPVAWWARRRVQEAEEQCCDAWVVWALPHAVHAYAAALVETIAFLSRPSLALPQGASGMGHVPLLKRRLTMILNQNAPRRLSWQAWLFLLPAVAVLPLLPMRAEPVQAAPQEIGQQEKSPADPAKITKPDDADPKPVEKKRSPATINRKREEDDDPQPDEKKRRNVIRVDDDDPRPVETKRPKVIRVDDPSSSLVSSSELEDAADEVELLRAQIEVKQAQLKSAKVRLDARNRSLKLLHEQASGTVSRAEFMKAEEDVQVLQTQVMVKEAELKEPMIKLRAAERRLARLQQLRQPGHDKAPVKDAVDPARGSDSVSPARMRELEKKIDTLMKEIELLRRELRDKKKAIPS